MRTLLIDTEYELEDCDLTSFESPISAFDYEVVVWHPARTHLKLIGSTHSKFENCPAPNQNVSVLWRAAIERRKTEFARLLELGRTVVIVLSPALRIALDTGERHYSGTGRNRVTTTLREFVDLMVAVPVDLQVGQAVGLNIELVHQRISTLWKRTEHQWIYRAYFNTVPGIPLLKIAGTDLIVASLVQDQGRGMTILIPELWIPSDEEGEGDPAEGQGPDDEDTDPLDSPRALLEWIRLLQEPSVIERPEWFEEYRFESETKRLADQSQLENQIAALEAALEKLKAEHAEDERWKWLISAQGAALEAQCKRAFELLGFESLESEPGRADLRLEHEGQVIVVEVKGVTKSGAESHAAQLEKWVATELEHGVTAKGVLVVNGWRHVPPFERTQANFPDQMVKYSTNRDHCLVSGLQLLVMARYVLEDESKAKEFRDLLVQTSGRLSQHDDYTAVLGRVVDVEATDDE